MRDSHSTTLPEQRQMEAEPLTGKIIVLNCSAAILAPVDDVLSTRRLAREYCRGCQCSAGHKAEAGEHCREMHVDSRGSKKYIQ